MYTRTIVRRSRGHHDHAPGLGQRGGHASGSGAVQGRDGGTRGGLHRSAA